MLRRLVGTLFFRYILGWRLENAFPDVGSCVIIVSPHTSNMDWFMGLMGFWHQGMQPNILIKKEAFKGIAGWLLKALGAIPVDRSGSKQYMTRQLAQQMREQTLRVVITPEGTRKKPDRWRTGFYHIAKAADVPIVPGYIDYSRKRAGYGPVLYPSEDREHDFAQLRSFYQANNFQGKYPAMASFNLQI
jgi:1-acyl-sn-glycerol-3-phosphate acyltransferase